MSLQIALPGLCHTGRKGANDPTGGRRAIWPTHIEQAMTLLVTADDLFAATISALRLDGVSPDSPDGLGASGLRGGFPLRGKRLPEQGATEQRVKVGIRVFAKCLKAFWHGSWSQMGNPG